MNKYRLLLLGIVPDDLKLENSMFSKHFLTMKIYEEFLKLDNVDIVCYDCRKKIDNLDFFDIILFIGYYDNWNKFDLSELKRKTKAKKIISFLEGSIEMSDWSFCFRSSNRKKETIFNPPCAKELYINKSKQKKSILIDHYWEDYLNTEKDWTYRIEDWLEEIKEDFKIYRLIRFKDEEKKIRSFEIPIFYSKFFEYIEKTDLIENFIITHHEGYPYGVIDMAVRGTRVLTPSKFIVDELKCKLNLLCFNNKEELHKILNSPIDEYWNHIDELCDDYSYIVNKIDEKIKDLLKDC